jgi:phosphopantetheine adenylyltransferase
MIGCYPGSFDPPTVAHLAVAEAAVAAAGLERLDLVISRVALGKEHLDPHRLAERVAVLEAVAATRPWLGVAVTDARLVTDIARSYDAVVMGADKWRQVNDPSWYADVAERDAAVASLPVVLVAPRGDDRPDGVQLLEIDDAHRHVSASAVRDGLRHATGWALPEAAGPMSEES